MPTQDSLQQKAGFCAATFFRPGGQGKHGSHKSICSLFLIQEQGRDFAHPDFQSSALPVNSQCLPDRCVLLNNTEGFFLHFV